MSTNYKQYKHACRFFKIGRYRLIVGKCKRSINADSYAIAIGNRRSCSEASVENLFETLELLLGRNEFVFTDYFWFKWPTMGDCVDWTYYDL